MNSSKNKRLLHEDDVTKIIQPIPYVQLIRASSTKLLLNHLIKDSEELNHILNEYPKVLYEPLDQHYSLMRCLGCLSEELISDLCNFYDWRGYVTAAYLTILSPNKAFEPYLSNVIDNAKWTIQGDWLLQLAIDEINVNTNRKYFEIQNKFRKLRNILSKINIPITNLRSYPSDDEIFLIQAFNEKIKRIYKEQGTQAALDMLKK